MTMYLPKNLNPSSEFGMVLACMLRMSNILQDKTELPDSSTRTILTLEAGEQGWLFMNDSKKKAAIIIVNQESLDITVISSPEYTLSGLPAASKVKLSIEGNNIQITAGSSGGRTIGWTFISTKL